MFQGFPIAALDFYEDLEADNSKVFWEANKETYRTAIAEPMNELTEALSAEFGPAKIFRPYRDVRFSKDKSPYKTAQGAYLQVAPATGYYVQINAAGLLVGAGFYQAPPERLAAMREAIDHNRSGRALERILATLGDAGWELGGDRLKTAPRGFDVDHPRIDLLRYKSLTVMREYGDDKVIHTPALVDRIRSDWRETTPLMEWLARHSQH